MDYRGLFIEMIARNITLEEIANHLTISKDYLTAKLTSKELLTLDDAARITDYFQLMGSKVSMNGLFTE
jgi:plasmid maintenance system antidote protein VapI